VVSKTVLKMASVCSLLKLRELGLNFNMDDSLKRWRKSKVFDGSTKLSRDPVIQSCQVVELVWID
jgi:hypothetical protein